MITVKNLTKSLAGKSVLKNIDFQIEAGEYVGLIGPNGAGKSTLLKILMGNIKPDMGEVVFEKKIKIGYVPQNFFIDHSFSLTVREILAMGLKRRSLWAGQKETELFIRKLQLVGLDNNFIDRVFHELSGGQKQRIVIAKSLLNDPELLLFDEPLNEVDYAIKIRIYQLLAHLNRELGITILFVSHEIERVITQCKRVLCLNQELHEGCHPVDFMLSDSLACDVDKGLQTNTPLEGVKPIHHHH